MKVWVNGTFDVLHIGHVSLLKYAASFGNVRVGIDSDRRVSEFKGKNRPVNNWQIRLYEPDYCIIGSDYRDKKVIGSQYCKSLIFFDKIEGHSTTKILNHG